MTTIANPGSKEAQDQGCICAVLDNGYGIQPDPAFGGDWVYTLGCPVHAPLESDTQAV